LNFLIFLDFYEIFAHTYSRAHTHILTLIDSHIHTPTLTHIRLIRIERVIVSIRYNGCRDGSCKVRIEEISVVIKWSKKIIYA
jgi:hypothetical protein